MSTRRVRVQTIVGLIALAWGLYGLGRLVYPADGPVGQPIPLRADLDWLHKLDVVLHLWIRLSPAVRAAWAAGMIATGLGLVLTKRPPLLAGLAVLVLPAILGLLLMPRDFALMAGWVDWQLLVGRGTDLSLEEAREITAGQGAAHLLAALLNTAYCVWLWREAKRMSARG